MAASAESMPGGAKTPRPLPRRVRQVVDYLKLMRLDRPIGIWLLLWPMLWALWMASGGHPDTRLVLVFLAGTVCMRSAGCVINDFADRNFDPHVRRTRERPLAARRVSPYEALVLFGLLCVIALALALTLNRLTLRLALIGAALTVTYPLMKRVFGLPQLYLGLAFGWAVPMAFAAQTGSVPRLGWLLLLAAILWAGVYDTIYAMVDRDDDLKIGVQSSAILFGDMDRAIIAVMQAMVLLALWLAGRTLHLGGCWYAGLIAGTVLFTWQQWLIRDRDRDACLRAFLNNNYFGMVVFIGLLLDQTTRH